LTKRVFWKKKKKSSDFYLWWWFVLLWGEYMCFSESNEAERNCGGLCWCYFSLSILCKFINIWAC